VVLIKLKRLKTAITASFNPCQEFIEALDMEPEIMEMRDLYNLLFCFSYEKHYDNILSNLSTEDFQQ
jgi:hypothetical protein